MTTGGNALKFYASQRLDIRRIGQIKDGDAIIGSRTRVKIVKNKVAPPFREAEFDVLYGIGISREGDLLDMAVEHEVIEKSGSWYSFQGSRLGQGREQVKEALKSRPELRVDIERILFDKLGIHQSASDSDAPPAQPAATSDDEAKKPRKKPAAT